MVHILEHKVVNFILPETPIMRHHLHNGPIQYYYYIQLYGPDSCLVVLPYPYIEDLFKLL